MFAPIILAMCPNYFNQTLADSRCSLRLQLLVKKIIQHFSVLLACKILPLFHSMKKTRIIHTLHNQNPKTLALTQTKTNTMM